MSLGLLLLYVLCLETLQKKPSTNKTIKKNAFDYIHLSGILNYLKTQYSLVFNCFVYIFKYMRIEIRKIKDCVTKKKSEHK